MHFSDLLDEVSLKKLKKKEYSLLFSLHGQISGYPSPELVLLKNGKEVNILAEERYNLTCSPDGNIDIQIHNCSFADDDEYSLLVENIAGVDSCNFELFVDCPGSNGGLSVT